VRFYAVVAQQCVLLFYWSHKTAFLLQQSAADVASFSQYVSNFGRLFDPNGTDERLKTWVTTISGDSFFLKRVLSLREKFTEWANFRCGSPIIIHC
jgi:hypothetical protein